VDRAVSQYAHHRRDGTETRPLEQAVLDPGSQYLDRSRYLARLEPFLRRFDRDQVHVMVQERLLRRREHEIARAYEHVGVDPARYDVPHHRRSGHRHAQHRHAQHRHAQHRHAQQRHSQHPASALGADEVTVPARLRAAILDRVGDDVERLRELLDDGLDEWRQR
jgi:hypothetical protein